MISIYDQVTSLAGFVLACGMVGFIYIFMEPYLSVVKKHAKNEKYKISKEIVDFKKKQNKGDMKDIEVEMKIIN